VRKTVLLPLNREGAARQLDVDIPRTVKDAQTIRLRGAIPPDSSANEPGDVYVRVRIVPNDNFVLEEQQLVLRHGMSLKEAVLGGAVILPTLDGNVKMTIPPRTESGAVFRIPRKGFLDATTKTRGDLRVRVHIVLPPDSEALRTFCEQELA
jgi:DnaJ-class molecular chaperone